MIDCHYIIHSATTTKQKISGPISVFTPYIGQSRPDRRPHARRRPRMPARPSPESRLHRHPILRFRSGGHPPISGETTHHQKAYPIGLRTTQPCFHLEGEAIHIAQYGRERHGNIDRSKRPAGRWTRGNGRGVGRFPPHGPMSNAFPLDHGPPGLALSVDEGLDEKGAGRQRRIPVEPKGVARPKGVRSRAAKGI